MQETGVGVKQWHLARDSRNNIWVTMTNCKQHNQIQWLVIQKETIILMKYVVSWFIILHNWNSICHIHLQNTVSMIRFLNVQYTHKSAEKNTHTSNTLDLIQIMSNICYKVHNQPLWHHSHHPSPLHSSTPGLKLSFSTNLSHHSLPFLLLDWLHRFPGLFTNTSEHIRFYSLVFHSSCSPLSVVVPCCRLIWLM